MYVAGALALHDGDRPELEALSRRPTALAQRARIVLLAADGMANTEIAARLGATRPTVLKWRRRYAEAGIGGLTDALRPGRPRRNIKSRREEQVMAAKPAVGRVTAVDQVVAAITTRIREGSLVAGQRLIESDLTSELSVSRGPLREALARLAAAGLVELEPYRGAVVRRLTPEEIGQLFDVREALEGMAARLAADAVAKGGDTGGLRAALDEMAGFRADPPAARAYVDATARFHDAIFRLSGNTLLQAHLGQLETHAYRLQFHQMFEAENRVRSIEDHEEVGHAILAGDAAGAEAAMRRHVRHAAGATRTWIRRSPA